MFRQLIAPHQRKLMMLSLLLFAVGVGLWAGYGTGHRLPITTIASSTECADAADVLVALERSRNGVSLTCNSETLRQGEVR